MKLKELAKNHDMKPVDLIALLEKEITPGCDALTELSNEQVALAEALLRPAAAPAANDSVLPEIRQHLAAAIVVDERNQAIAQEVSRMVALYQSDTPSLPEDESVAALVKEVSARTKKRQPLWDGQVLSLAEEVEIIDGEVILPPISIPLTPTVPVSLESLPEPPLKSAAPALPRSEPNK